MKHPRSTAPDEISRAQYIKALKAFTKALGVDPGATLFPMVLNHDSIDLCLLVPDNNGNKMLARHDIGNTVSLVAAHTRITVSAEVMG